MNNLAELEELDAYFDHILLEIEDPDCPPVENPFKKEIKVDMSNVIRFYYTVPVKVNVSADGLSASFFISSHREGEITLEELQKAAADRGVKAGIDESVLEKIVSEQILDTEIVFATGTPAVNGKDGTVEITAQADTDVKEGDVICLFVPGEEGTDGTDVLGNAIPAVNGHAPDIPQGKNTRLNDSRTALEAAADGKLMYEDGVFSVRNEYIVEGDLKRPNDQILFGGDVVIYGNVSEGANIVAGGNVYIRGSITGATVKAKNITADFTVRSSTLTSEGGNIKVPNCEHSELHCDGNIHASTFTDCKVFCSGEILCLSGQGAISGGTIYSVGKVVCQTVGSQMHEPVRVILGHCADFVKERRELSEKIAVIDNDIYKLDFHADSLKARKAETGVISQEDEDFLRAATRIRLQKKLLKEPLETRLKYVEHTIAEADNAILKATNTLHQNVTITIKEHTATTNIRHNKVTVYASDTGLIYM